MLPESVRSTMLKSVNVTVMTIILNAMLRLGVNKTDIIQHHVLSRTMLTSPAPVTALSIKVVKETMTGLVKNSIIQRLVLPDRS